MIAASIALILYVLGAYQMYQILPLADKTLIENGFKVGIYGRWKATLLWPVVAIIDIGEALKERFSND